MGERLEEAAKRELYEETGLIARNIKLYGTFSGPELHYIYPHGDEVYVVDTVYICEEFDGEEKADTDEVSELKWFAYDEIPAELCPPTKDIILKFISEKLK